MELSENLFTRRVVPCSLKCNPLWFNILKLCLNCQRKYFFPSCISFLADYLQLFFRSKIFHFGRLYENLLQFSFRFLHILPKKKKDKKYLFSFLQSMLILFFSFKLKGLLNFTTIEPPKELLMFFVTSFLSVRGYRNPWGFFGLTIDDW